jgi:hypothetical protein
MGNTYKAINLNSSGSGGSGSGLSNTIYADSNAASGGDGSMGEPFNSLQDAIDSAELLGKETRKIIMIASGSSFDEDITITGGLMEIIGLGPWNLGDGIEPSVIPYDPFGSSVPRSITYNSDGTLTNGKWPSLVIGTIMDDESSSTHTAYLNAATISGDFIFNAGGVSHNLQLRNVKIKGDYISSGVGGIQGYFRRCYFDNFFTGTNTFLNIVESCQFDKLVTCGSHARIWQCEFRDGMTTGQLNSPLPPNGMYDTNFKGTFTGPVGSLLLDSETDYFFELNNASLAGGATKVFMHHTSVTFYDDVTDAGSGAIITASERADIDTNSDKVSADGSVTTHSDVTDAGSGAIITASERSDINGSVTAHNDVTSAGSGSIITASERASLDDIDDKFDIEGNPLTSDAVLGSTTDFDVTMIRNNTEMLKMTEGTYGPELELSKWVRVKPDAPSFGGHAAITGKGIASNKTFYVESDNDDHTGSTAKMQVNSGQIWNSGDFSSGELSLKSGAVTVGTGASGNVNIKSGNTSPASSSGDSGTLSVRTGDVNSGNSGNIIVRPGSSTGGLRGSINLEAEADKVKLQTQPTGADDLAVATTKYVDDNAGGALGSVTDHTDVTSAGSGAIITGSERASLGDIAANTAKVSADGSVTSHSDITSAGSGDIITGSERALLSTASQSSLGDINETQGTLLDNQAVAVPTGMAFSNTVVGSFVSHLSIVRGSLYEKVTLEGIQKASSWEIAEVRRLGDPTGISFSIDAAGQVLYTSTNTGDTANMQYRADTTSYFAGTATSYPLNQDFTGSNTTGFGSYNNATDFNGSVVPTNTGLVINGNPSSGVPVEVYYNFLPEQYSTLNTSNNITVTFNIINGDTGGNAFNDILLYVNSGLNDDVYDFSPLYLVDGVQQYSITVTPAQLVSSGITGVIDLLSIRIFNLVNDGGGGTPTFTITDVSIVNS